MKTSKYKKYKKLSYADGYEYVYDKETKRYVLREGDNILGQISAGFNKYVAEPVSQAYDAAVEEAKKLAKEIEDGVNSIDPKKVIKDMKAGFEKDIIRSIQSPFTVRKSTKDHNVLLFYAIFQNRMICSVIKQTPEYSFLITTYPCDSVKKGEILWQK